jgi:DNA polymerase (family 10)
MCKHLQAEFEENPSIFPADYAKPKMTFEDNAVQMNEKVRYPKIIFDPYVKALKILAKGTACIDKYEICGSYRRLANLVSDLDLLVTLSDPSKPESIREFYSKIQLAYPNHEIKAQGDLKFMIMLDGKVHLDVKVVPAESWGSALMHFTGSKVENIRLRSKASRMNLKLNEYGLWTEDEINLAEGKDEREIYELLKEQYKAPWER